MELTQEYFDQQLAQLNKRLDAVATKEDLKDFVTKQDLGGALQAQTTELKSYTDQQTETLARIIATTIAEPMEKHFAEVKSEIGMKRRVELLETKVIKLQEALHLTL